ncbi:helix-turn-helix domain-containing protein [Thalassobacillus devorans]|uniref:helix-turn-helix domain-containing protein n=1 Tax=Thalassobacillus devorans TaxID=279813 RepID=UPI00048DB2AF|nr:helix-turn-helix domain-containing protein [Thalassobacillus devorans]
MALKGQKKRTYPFELKMEALTLKKKGWTKRQIANKLGIHDRDLIKAWARKYRAQGAYGLVDRRGRGSKKNGEYTDQERYIRSLEMENDVLKKYFEILGKEKR